MKHAYLIMAHNEFEILEKLMGLLDDERNDFYIHIDKKAKDFPFTKFQSLTKYSKVVFIDRQDIRWGHHGQIQCELSLLEAAVKGNYRYYHLLSGVDLPLRSNDEIHAFFRENDGKELVHFACAEERKDLYDRVSRFHCMRMMASRNPLIRKVGNVADTCLWRLYRAGVHRSWDADKVLGYGANWFSITHELAQYVLSQKHWIQKYFRLSACADELFLQTIVENSRFRDALYWPARDNDMRANMRHIDWERSNGKNPWTYRMEDYEMLVNAPHLFARKFSTAVDAQVVEAIYQHVKAKNEG